MLNQDEIRSKFPALKLSTIFMDNAGGSQLPDYVINRIKNYYINSYVQVGADYEVAKQATGTIDRAREFLEICFNARGLGKVIMGPSTSALCAMLADCYRRAFDPKRDEIVICQAGHEANVGPWARLKHCGYTIKTWRLNPANYQCSLEDLEDLVTDKTRIVAFVHTSNLLGEVVDAKRICDIARKKGARTVIDGVAYAPHRVIDVKELGCDYYVYSAYKVFGPHMAALYGKNEALQELIGPNHYFVKDDDIPYKFELGGVLHEGCAGILGLWDYFCFLTQTDPKQSFNRRVIEDAYQIIEDLESPLTQRLLNYLGSKEKVTIIGQDQMSKTRVSTISFIHENKTSKEIAIAANNKGFGIRYGHFYAHRLCEPLNLDPEDVVVRVSMVHYNTMEELDKLCAFFDTIL